MCSLNFLNCIEYYLIATNDSERNLSFFASAFQNIYLQCVILSFE
jgi:hypothetical protein